MSLLALARAEQQQQTAPPAKSFNSIIKAEQEQENKA